MDLKLSDKKSNETFDLSDASEITIKGKTFVSKDLFESQVSRADANNRLCIEAEREWKSYMDRCHLLEAENIDLKNQIDAILSGEATNIIDCEAVEYDGPGRGWYASTNGCYPKTHKAKLIILEKISENANSNCAACDGKGYIPMTVSGVPKFFECPKCRISP